MSPLLYTLIVTHITIAAVTMFLHRGVTHKSVSFHPIVSHFFRCWLWLTTGMVTKEWVAIHRKHHAKCETKDDPHSPVYKGVWNVMFLGVLFYKQESKCQETLEMYGQETPDDWLERNVYAKYSGKGILITLAFNMYMFGIGTGGLIWLIQMAWIPFWAAGFINGIGHWFGYRTFASKDTSTNISPLILPLGIIIGGEEFHNNHHAFPRSAKLGYKKWEFDIGWMYIRILERLGLAKVSHATIAPESKSMVFQFDDKTSHFANKMRSLRKFEKIVFLRAVKSRFGDIKDGLETSYKKTARIALTDKDAMTKEENATFAKLINSDEWIKKVNNFKDKLEEIWQGVGIELSERTQKMKHWCKEIEATGNSDLIKFSKYIKRKMGIVEEKNV